MTDTPVETPAEEKVEKPLSKAEQRIKLKNDQYMQHLQREAENTHRLLCGRFNEFLILCEEPSEEILRQKAKQVSAQWKLYVKTKHLKDNVLNLVGDFCEKTIAEFLALQEAPKEETSSPAPETVPEGEKEQK